MNLDKHKATYDGKTLDCLSLRNGPWDEMREIIKEAFKQGYNHYVIDDAVLLFHDNGGELVKDQAEFTCCDSVEEMICKIAAEWAFAKEITMEDLKKVGITEEIFNQLCDVIEDHQQRKMFGDDTVDSDDAIDLDGAIDWITDTQKIFQKHTKTYKACFTMEPNIHNTDNIVQAVYIEGDVSVDEAKKYLNKQDNDLRWMKKAPCFFEGYSRFQYCGETMVALQDPNFKKENPCRQKQ